MLVVFRTFVAKRQFRVWLNKFVDNIFTMFGIIILTALLLAFMPLLILDHWLSGDR
jgi:hypothetical protein